MKFVSGMCAFLAIITSMTGCGKNEEPKAAAPTAELICSLAPSQSKLVTAFVGATGGAAVTAAALAQALGLTAVAHSSGALILTGSGGYVAGTLGAAATGPAIVGVGIVVAGSAVTVELLCAPSNHASSAKRVEEAATEFLRRSKVSFSGAMSDAGKTTEKTKVKILNVSGDVFEYAFRN